MNILALLNPIAALSKPSDEAIRNYETSGEFAELMDVEESMSKPSDIPAKQPDPSNHATLIETTQITYHRTPYTRDNLAFINRKGSDRSASQHSPAPIPPTVVRDTSLYQRESSLAESHSSLDIDTEPAPVSTRFFDFFLRGQTTLDAPYVVRHASETTDNYGDTWTNLPQAAHISNQANLSFKVHDVVRVCFDKPPSGHAKIIELRKSREECIAVVQWLYTKSDAKDAGLTTSRARAWPSRTKLLSNHYQIIPGGNIDRLDDCRISKHKMFDARNTKTLQRLSPTT